MMDDAMRVSGVYRLLESSRIYRSWQALSGNANMYQVFVGTHVRPREGDVIIDIGCGPGEVLDYIPAGRYVGLDVNPDYIHEARARYDQRGEFHAVSLEDSALPEYHGAADLVTAIGVLHHLDDAAARHCVALANTLLKPGGRFVTLDGVYHAGQGFVRRTVLALDRGRYVRDVAGYFALAATAFSRIEHEIYDNLTRIPSSFLALECVKPTHC
jgi:SAM-dependent methyltransferase